MGLSHQRGLYSASALDMLVRAEPLARRSHSILTAGAIVYMNQVIKFSTMDKDNKQTKWRATRCRRIRSSFSCVTVLPCAFEKTNCERSELLCMGHGVDKTYDLQV